MTNNPHPYYRIAFFLALIWLPIALFAEPETGLTLDSCLRLAQQNSVAIRKAELEVERAHQVRMQALTKFFPQVQGTAVGYHALEPLVEVGLEDIGNASVREMLLLLYGNFGASLGLDNTLSLFQHGYSAGVTALQPVFMGGKIVAGNQLARLGVEAAELQEQLTERDLLEQVEQSYWLVVGLQDKKRTVERVTLFLDTLAHIVSSAVETGLALETDRMAVQVKQAELAQQHLLLSSGLTLATRALAQSIGWTDAASLRVEPPVIEVNPYDETDLSLPGTSDHVSVEQQLLAMRVRASELQRNMTIGDALPKVVVAANYGYSHTDGNVFRQGLGGWNGALFAMVSVPLTGWWETGHKIREQNILLEEARLEQQDLEEKLALRNQQYQNQLMVSALLVEQAERTLSLSQQRLRFAEIAYGAGTATITELLTAQIDCLTAENALTDARITYALALRSVSHL